MANGAVGDGIYLQRKQIGTSKPSCIELRNAPAAAAAVV